MFEPVTAAVEAIAPGIEVLRPGMVACAARGPVRYFGSEEAAAERIVDAVEALDVECTIGIADVLPVAVLAARESTYWSPAADRRRSVPTLPITELARDPVIAPPERADLVDLLIRLGHHHGGAFAALPAERVATRFGADAVVAHRLARGLGERGVYRRTIPQDLTDRGDPATRRWTGWTRPRSWPGHWRERFHARTGRRRAGLHPAVDHRPNRARCHVVPDLALCPAADRRGHRRPAALAAGRLAHRWTPIASDQRRPTRNQGRPGSMGR